MARRGRKVGPLRYRVRAEEREADDGRRFWYALVLVVEDREGYELETLEPWDGDELLDDVAWFETHGYRVAVP